MTHFHVVRAGGESGTARRSRTTALLILAFVGLLTTCGAPVAPVDNSTGSGGVTPPPVNPPPGDTTPPSVPGGLSATPDGPFGASLKWTASTDNVGVTGYSVERCQGSGCGGFVPVGITAGPAFEDTALSATTTYSYRVRATDAAANASGPSAVATMTTGAAPPPPLSTLPAWLSSHAINEWFQIPNSSISSVDPAVTPNGNTGPESKIETWTSMVVDTRNSNVYSVANGGHQDYSGNEVDRLNLEADAPAWTEVLAPTPNNQLANCSSYYNDGRPVSRHSYYGMTFAQQADRIMLFGGANWCDKGGFHAAISSYNITANTYNGAAAHPNVPDAMKDGVPAYSVDPSTDNVYMFRNGDWGVWNRQANTFTQLNKAGTGPNSTVGESMSAMDTSRGRILMLGGEGPVNTVYTISTNSFTTLSLPLSGGANATTVANAGQGAMIYVPALDRFLVRLAASGGTVYVIHPTTFAVTTLTTTGGSTIPVFGAGASGGGPYNKFLYVPRLGGAIYLPSYLGNAWFIRLN